MKLGIENKRAIICGGSKGLGLACAKALLDEGCLVTLISRSQENLDKAKKDLGAGDKCRLFSADISTSSGVEKCLKDITSSGGADILVYNTGGPQVGGVLDHSDEAWMTNDEALLQSCRRIMQGVVPFMRNKKWGRIIAITSIVVREPARNLALSSVYRAAVTAYCKLLAKELAADNITVNAVMPGSFLTERTEYLMGKRAESEQKSIEEVMKTRKEQLPQGRFQKPEELGTLVAFLSSVQACSITGTSIPVDGGLMVSI